MIFSIRIGVRPDAKAIRVSNWSILDIGLMMAGLQNGASLG
jgi:hypothetical protein